MSALLLIVLVGVAIVVTVRSARRGLSDRHTVEEHHRTLDTLAEIAHRQDTEGRVSERPPPVGPSPAQPHIRVMPPGGSQPTAARPPVRWPPAKPAPAEPPPAEPPPASPPSTGDLAVPPSEPLTDPATLASHAVPPDAPAPSPFAEPARPVEPVPPIAPVLPAAEEAAPLPGSLLPSGIPPLSAPITPPPRAPSRPAPVPPEPAAPLVALTVGGGEVAPEPRHRWRRGVIVGVSAAATILVAVGAITLLPGGTGSGGHRPRSPAGAAPASPSPVTPPTTAAPKGSAVLIDKNSQGARYSVEPSTASIELVPTSACWVQVRTGSASGPVTFQGTMHVGDRLPLPTSGPVWLRLGNPPGISIVVNGTPLHLVTASVAQPYNLELQPAS
jgi:hypothetical protein